MRVRVCVSMEGSSTSRAARLERKHASELQERHLERVRPIHVLKGSPKSSTLLLSRSGALVRLAAAPPARLGKECAVQLSFVRARCVAFRDRITAFTIQFRYLDSAGAAHLAQNIEHSKENKSTPHFPSTHLASCTLRRRLSQTGALVEQGAWTTPVADLREARPLDRRSRLRRTDSENYGPASRTNTHAGDAVGPSVVVGKEIIYYALAVYSTRTYSEGTIHDWTAYTTAGRLWERTGWRKANGTGRKHGCMEDEGRRLSVRLDILPDEWSWEGGRSRAERGYVHGERAKVD